MVTGAWYKVVVREYKPKGAAGYEYKAPAYVAAGYTDTARVYEATGATAATDATGARGATGAAATAATGAAAAYEVIG